MEDDGSGAQCSCSSGGWICWVSRSDAFDVASVISMVGAQHVAR
jgi:hypothetical protein